MKAYSCTIHNGHLVSDELTNDLLNPKAKGLKVRVTVEAVTDRKRSAEQNSYLWKVVYGNAVGHYRNNVGDFIRDLMLATKAFITTDFVHSMFKMWFNQGKTTTKMDTIDMMVYIEKIREHFYHNHGVEIPEPTGEENENL